MRPVRYPLSSEGTLKVMYDHPHSLTGQKLFPTIRSALCFAALVGYECDKREPLSGETSALDARLVFGNAPTVETIYSIALADSRDMDIIRPENEEKMVNIFEEYIAGGLQEITAWLRETPGDVDGADALIAAAKKRGYLGTDDEADHDDIPSIVF